mgnify:CR=1 FL=1
MSKNIIRALAAAAALATGSMAAHAQQNIFKVGVIEYTTNSKTNGIHGAGVPPGADAETGDATTLLLTYERALTPNIGVELVIGVPPKITAKATGTVAFLGDDVLSAKNVAPTLLVNYHFGVPGDAWRPYAGAGINYTKFVSVKSKLAPDVKMSDSTGLAVQLGIDYAPSKDWGLFASIARVDVKSKLVATGATVLQTKIDFAPRTYEAGVWAAALVGQSPAAGVAEVHEMKMEGDVMKMRAIPALDLPAGKTVELKPGGYHVMLMDLKAPLAKDTTVPVTLMFKDAKGADSRMDVQVPVSATAPAGSATGGHKH